MDSVYPLCDLRVNPVCFCRSGTDEASTIAMSICACKVEFIKCCEGGSRGIDRSDEYGLVGFGEVASAGTKLKKKALCFRNGGDGTDQGAIIGIPRLNSGGDGAAE